MAITTSAPEAAALARAASSAIASARASEATSAARRARASGGASVMAGVQHALAERWEVISASGPAPGGDQPAVTPKACLRHDAGLQV